MGVDFFHRAMGRVAEIGAAGWVFAKQSCRFPRDRRDFLGAVAERVVRKEFSLTDRSQELNQWVKEIVKWLELILLIAPSLTSDQAAK